MKKVLAIALAAIMVLSLAACGGNAAAPAETQAAAQAEAQAEAQGEAAAEKVEEAAPAAAAGADENKKLTISYIHSDASIQASVSTEIGVKNALEKNGWDWTLDVEDAFGDTANLAKLIENAVAKGVDGILIDYADLRSCTNSLKVAKDAGIPVISIDAGYTPNTVCDITSNNYEGASKNMMYYLEKQGTTGNAIIFDLDISAGCRQRSQVYQAVLNENTGIKLLEYYNVDVTKIQQDVMDAMETFIQKYGVGGENGITAVLAAWDEAGYAAAMVLKQHGYTDKDCMVISQDGHYDVAVSYMLSDPDWPLISTVVQKFDTFGEIAMDIFYKLCCLGMSEDEANGGVRTHVVIGNLVTKETVGTAQLIESDLGKIVGDVDDYFYGDFSEPTSYQFAK